MNTVTEPNRAILAQYEDIAAQHTARVDGIGEEFAAELARQDALAAERARAAAEALPAAEAAREAARAPQEPVEPSKPDWGPRQNRQVVMSFGDEELRAEAAPRTTPIPVQAAPPTTPIPVPEPVREAQPPRYLSFGGEEDEAEAALPPRVQRRPVRPSRPAEPDDDDLSGHTWMR
ncbi:hypothetical protein DFQ13_103325 [Actinokineospora spheciospongiae]|nr:hypothetical protein DFQ13_103325 [Actinokineospora spheciospongiae]